MSKKVMLTKEQVNALSNFISNGYTLDDFARHHGSLMGARKPLNTLTLDEMARALYVGYVDPHEKIHEIYKEAHEGAHGVENIRFHEGVAYGVFETLKALNEKVDGINHDSKLD